MKPKDFKTLVKWFNAYVCSYLTEYRDDNHAIRLKEKHTYRVCGNIALLARELNLSEQDLLLSKTMALFHDLGRFKQYRQYGTFSDRASENHAAIGIAEIDRHQALPMCTDQERDLIISAISQHNTAALPQNGDQQALFFMRLLRDADKLDIWKVFCDYYRENRRQPDKAHNDTIVFGLADLPEYTPDAIRALNEGRSARIEDLRTLTDFKLLQISWVYDLNFTPAFRALKKRAYIERIASELPQTPEIIAAVKKTRSFIQSAL